MKLTRQVKATLVKLFKDGSDMQYLAATFGFRIEQIEGVIREWMVKQTEEMKE